MSGWIHSTMILGHGTRWEWVVNFKIEPIYPGIRAPAIAWIRGRVDSKTCPNAVEWRKISFPCKESKPDFTARGQSYRLSYRGALALLIGLVCWAIEGVCSLVVLLFMHNVSEMVGFVDTCCEDDVRLMMCTMTVII